jgi:hypothetical protein
MDTSRRLTCICLVATLAACLAAAGCGQPARGQQRSEVQAEEPPAGRLVRKFLAKRKKRRKERASETADPPAPTSPADDSSAPDPSAAAGATDPGATDAGGTPDPDASLQHAAGGGDGAVATQTGGAAASGGAARRPLKPRRLTLEQALDLAREGIQRAAEIKDYTCTLLKRERVGRKLGEEQRLFMKIRHEPFSVYTRFEAPDDLKGQEAIYVEGQNDGMLIAHTTGLTGKVVGTVRLDPTGYLAMNGNRHPITSAGIKNLLVQLVALGENEPRAARCKLTYGPGPEIDGRPCRRLEIVQDAPQGDFRLARVRIDIDEEWQLPVHYAAYEWSRARQPEAELVEEYTYLNLQFNVGLTDRDFDPANREYRFP